MAETAYQTDVPEAIPFSAESSTPPAPIPYNSGSELPPPIPFQANSAPKPIPFRSSVPAGVSQSQIDAASIGVDEYGRQAFTPTIEPETPRGMSDAEKGVYRARAIQNRAVVDQTGKPNPVNPALPSYQEQAAGVAAGNNAYENFAQKAIQTPAKIGTELIGTVAPGYAADQQDSLNDLPIDDSSLAAKAGEFVAGGVVKLPGYALGAGTAGVQEGVLGAGRARIDAERRRRAGQEVSGGQELLSTGANALISGATGAAGAKLLPTGGNLATNLAANLGGAAGIGYAQKIAENASNKAIYGDKTGITEGAGDAALHAAIGQAIMSGIHHGLKTANKFVGPEPQTNAPEIHGEEAAVSYKDNQLRKDAEIAAPIEAKAAEVQARADAVPDAMHPEQLADLEAQRTVADSATRRAENIPTKIPYANENRPPEVAMKDRIGIEDTETRPISDSIQTEPKVESAETRPPERVSRGQEIVGKAEDLAATAQAPADEQKVQKAAPVRETPVEPAAAKTPEEPVSTSARKEQMTEDRAAMGLDELNSPERKSWQTSIDNAKRIGIPEKAMRIAAEVNDNPRALNDDETAGLVIHASKLKGEHSDLMSRIGEATDPADIQTLSAEASRVEQDFDQLSTALRSSGTEKGRALASQKLAIDQNYELLPVLNRAKAAKGKDLAPAEKARFESLTKRLDESNARVTKLEQQMKEQVASQAIKRRAAERIAPQDRATRLKTNYAKLKELMAAGCNN